MFARDLGADLTVGREAVGIAEHIVERKIQLELARRILERQGVVSIPGTAFGRRGRGYLRLSFAATEEQITEGIRRIARELA